MHKENSAVEVENLSKIYKLYERPVDRLKESINPFGKKYHNKFYALNDVSFNVNKGETIGILGRNGSGKSTLLQIITGVLSPTKGRVNVNGKISALLELGAGFNPELSGIDNVYLNGTIMGYGKEEMDKKMDKIISFADIGEYIHQPVKMYSSGMFVRLAFAVAINVDPDVLIVDEALAVGDMQFQLKCIDKIKTFKKQGKTILFVSHDPYQVRNFCDQAIWLMDGKIHNRGDVNLITEMYIDFMKHGLEDTSNVQGHDQKTKIMLSIDKVSISDISNKERKDYNFGESIKVTVDFTINKPLQGLVGGVALYDKQRNYVCGLNTKLDDYSLPHKPGKYQLNVSYHDMHLLPGTYFIDVGFFESSAIVIIDYKSKAEFFTISSGEYFAEGLTFIKHSWECRG